MYMELFDLYSFVVCITVYLDCMLKKNKHEWSDIEMQMYAKHITVLSKYMYIFVRCWNLQKTARKLDFITLRKFRDRKEMGFLIAESRKLK